MLPAFDLIIATDFVAARWKRGITAPLNNPQLDIAQVLIKGREVVLAQFLGRPWGTEPTSATAKASVETRYRSIPETVGKLDTKGEMTKVTETFGRFLFADGLRCERHDSGIDVSPARLIEVDARDSGLHTGFNQVTAIFRKDKATTRTNVQAMPSKEIDRGIQAGKPRALGNLLAAHENTNRHWTQGNGNVRH
jgi:hypothetical protein